MKKSVLPFLTLAVLSFACKTPQQTTVESPTSTTVTTAEYSTMVVTKNNIYQKPKVADLSVNAKRVKITMTYENISVDDAKELIKGEFMKQEKCDIIVQPYFYSTTTYNTDGTSVRITITGLPAFYRNIHNYTNADAIYFERWGKQ